MERISDERLADLVAAHRQGSFYCTDDEMGQILAELDERRDADQLAKAKRAAPLNDHDAIKAALHCPHCKAEVPLYAKLEDFADHEDYWEFRCRACKNMVYEATPEQR
ncbi:MAG TPA: hypothetical protein VFW62_01250, partial [bacterium]|nr:hypothetical protein [bacterium]